MHLQTNPIAKYHALFVEVFFMLHSEKKKKRKALLWTEDIGSTEVNRSSHTGSRNSSCSYQDDFIFTQPLSLVTTNHPSVPLAWHWNAQLGMYANEKWKYSYLRDALAQPPDHDHWCSPAPCLTRGTHKFFWTRYTIWNEGFITVPWKAKEIILKDL